MARSPDALKHHGDGAGRPYLADEIDHADVYSQLQRGCSHAHLDLTALQLLLGGKPCGAGEAAVVRHHRLISKSLGQLVGDALHHSAGVDEDQGCAVGPDQVGDVVQGLGPLLVGGDGAKLSGWQLYRQVQVASVARVHNQAVGSPVLANVVVAHKETRHLLNGLLCGRQPDSGDWSLRQRA